MPWHGIGHFRSIPTTSPVSDVKTSAVSSIARGAARYLLDSRFSRERSTLSVDMVCATYARTAFRGIFTDELGRSMRIKKFLQRLIRRLGWEIRPITSANIEQQVVKELLKLARVNTVLDVGANSGQWGDLLFETGYSGRLISFEAVPAVHAVLLAHAKMSGKSWDIAPCAALGGEPGQMQFNLSANTLSSSALQMRGRHVAAAPDSVYIAKQMVSVERLDHLAAPFMRSDSRLMLKIDTQGYELEVLRGATGLLERVDCMQVELSLVGLYEGAPSYLEMLTYIKSLGFEIFNFVPVFKDRRSGQVLQVDGFFFRSDLTT
jgi:FkbM family methyltransferase